MTLPPVEDNALPPCNPTAAEREASCHWQANLSAIAATQPRPAAALESAGPPTPAEADWTYGRDGTLTARVNADGRPAWLAGCSLPGRVAQSLLRELDVRGVVGCFLRPAHGAQVQTALTAMRPSQALIVLSPDLDELRLSLCCCDFSADVAAHRLWFAASGDWADELTALLTDRPGLPTPAQFVRTPTTAEESAITLMAPAERVFAQVNARRAALAAELLARPRGPMPAVPRLLVAAPSSFRLWDNAGQVLLQTLTREPAGPFAPARALDVADPASASATALALAAADADVVVTADVARADLPAVIPAAVPVVCWVTTPRVPAYDARFPADALLVADAAWASEATRAGWPARQVAVAAWPAVPLQACAVSPTLALIGDTRQIRPPAGGLSLSSHQLLWDRVEQELRADPLALGDDGRAFLRGRMREFNISEQGMDWATFEADLLLPAFAQGIARLLLAAGVPLRLYGTGWGEMVEFRGAWAGLIEDEADLRRAVASAAALVAAWRASHAHGVDAFGLPVLRSAALSADEYIRLARQMIARRCDPRHAPAQRISAEAVLSVLLD